VHAVLIMSGTQELPSRHLASVLPLCGPGRLARVSHAALLLWLLAC
jgi:hypothetical protein